MLAQGHESTVFVTKFKIDALFIIYFIAGILFSFPWWRKAGILRRLNIMPLRYCALMVLLVLSMCSRASNAYSPLVYFRF